MVQQGMLDYKLLEALGCVIQEQGFDKAAKKMCITQSAVSQRIKALEEQTGQILVTRTAPPRATAHGQRLLKHYLQVSALESDLARQRKGADQGFTTLALGINADSLATWFFPAVEAFLTRKKVMLDLRVDDQDQTHKMLRNGEVSACISSEKKPVQGCRATFLGTMNYRLAAAPDYARDHNLFDKTSGRLDPHRLAAAPAVIFNRKDDLHQLFFRACFDLPLPRIPVHYVPSSEGFARTIRSGLACGMIPDFQGLPLIQSGELMDLAPHCHIRVDLYWHCWHIGSDLLEEFSREIVKKAVIC